MEVRSLTTAAERDSFEKGLREARATRDDGFRAKVRSRAGDIHLQFAHLYGVYDDKGPAPRDLLGGFSLHALDEFSQSHPRPDLSHLPAHCVFEAGAMWSLARGIALNCQLACLMLLSRSEVKAILTYPIIRPWNRAVGYEMFTKIGEPFEVPFIETLRGDAIWVQAMVLSGLELKGALTLASQYGFETQGGSSLIFRKPEIGREEIVRICRNLVPSNSPEAISSPAQLQGSFV
jgi:hypothetical protein